MCDRFCIKTISCQKWFLRLKDLLSVINKHRDFVRDKYNKLKTNICTIWMEWIHNDCFCWTSPSALECIKAVNSSSAFIREFCTGRFTLLYPFFRAWVFIALLDCPSGLCLLMLRPFWFRFGNFSETNVTRLLLSDWMYRGPEFWLDLQSLASFFVLSAVPELFSGSSWAAELPNREDRWRFLSAVYFALFTSS